MTEQSPTRTRNREGWITPTAGELLDTGRSAASAGDDKPAISLPDRLDDAAARLHAVAAPRVAITALGGLLSLMILPHVPSGVWIAAALAVEVWSWFATRPQSRGEAIAPAVRANFVASYGAINALWVLLGALFCHAGTPAGMASGLSLIVAIGSLFVLLFYTAPVAFLLAGAAPAVAALVVVCLTAGGDWRQLAPVWMMVGLATLFSFGRAIGAPSAQAQQLWLSQSLRSFKILADNISDVIVRVDRRGVFQYVSPASLTALGYRPDELLGASVRGLLHPESVVATRAALVRLAADPGRNDVVTVRLRHRDGRWLWFQTSVATVRADGVATAFICVARDITEQAAAEQALHVAKAEAEAANAAKGEFLANVSHEIRTPMNAILGALHLLEGEPISAEGGRLIEQAKGSGAMLSQLLNDVLDLSKIEAGQLELAAEPTDVAEVLRSVTALLQGSATAKGLQLSAHIEADGRWHAIDPVRLRQILFNLIGNAVKFTDRGQVTVRLRQEPAGDARSRLRFEVEDTGIGMTPQTLARVFERFRQGEGDSKRRFSGTGLGLSISQALANRMGGCIGCESAEGVGSTFWFEFEAPVAAAPVVHEAPEHALLDGVRVLLVDDNEINRLVAHTMLVRLGADIEEAEDGVDALERARRGPHDLILMDIQMPRMDGVEATRAIRALAGAAGRIPIIGVTANVMAHQRASYLAAGMDAVVAKPINPSDLISAIAAALAVDAQDVETAAA